MIAVVLSGIELVRDVAVHRAARRSTSVGAVLSVVGMGGVVLGILVWQEGGEAVGALLAHRRGRAWSVCAGGWCAASARASRHCSTRTCSGRSCSGSAISGQMLQQIALGGTMIALPIYLQMVLEYNAMEAGLSLAPLSLSMFARRADRRQAGRQAPAEQHHPRGFVAR